VRRYPVFDFGAIALSLACTLVTTILYYGLCDGLGTAWIVSVTGVTFLAFGYDKAISGSGWTRVPEKVLLTLALAGGTVGALAGMRIFRHKTAKKPFGFNLKLIMAFQAGALAVWVLNMKGLL
jgi:uncharacterized membrane protein YsdA (DUF1294 family)